MTPAHVTTVIAGTGTIGRSGDGGPGVAAEIEYPVGITISEGVVLFAEATANRVRRIGPDGVITTVAGTTKTGWSGDGGLATKARLASPTDVAFDPHGDLYVVDQDNQRLRRIDTDGVISTVAGTGEMDHSGDGGQSVDAALDAPFGVVIDRAGDVLVTEEGRWGCTAPPAEWCHRKRSPAVGLPRQAMVVWRRDAKLRDPDRGSPSMRRGPSS
jgi:hypothetical protein